MGIDVHIIVIIVTCLLASLLLTRVMRKVFTRFRSQELKAGKELIYRHFPKHKKPLGGGVAIFGTLIIGLLLAQTLGVGGAAMNWRAAWIWLCCGLAYGAIGFIDDWRKVKAARGLDERTKLLLQIAFAVVFTIFILLEREALPLAPNAIFVPFHGWVIYPWLFLVFGVLVLVGTSNAVNLTDGIDGLAGTSLALAFAGYLALGSLLHGEGGSTVIPLLALVSLSGFLFYNRPPAKIIMGDTGALGLGAALGALALLSGTEWLLLLIGAPFVINTVSVLLQMGTIKFFRGPWKLLRHQTTEVFRPFLCTPLHHHFQWLTWGPWPILALYSGVGLLSVVLAVLAMPAVNSGEAYAWFWVAGLALQAGFLAFAGLQKMVRATYFLGLELPDGGEERLLALYKGLPMEVFGVRWYSLEEITAISEGMVNAVAAEGLLWRNISEIEARATLGKIYAEYKMFDRAAEEWEEIPLRNLLIRENIVVQLGKIYFGREELLRAVKLWEQLPPSRLARVPGLPETIQSAKVRVGHLAGRLYHQAREHAGQLRQREERARAVTIPDITALTAALEGALRYTQDLRDLLGYEQHKAEGSGELDGAEDGAKLYRRMDTLLASRRDELLQDLEWAKALIEPGQEVEGTPLEGLAQTLRMMPAEISRVLEVKALLPVRAFNRIEKPSRNTLYRIDLEAPEHLPDKLIAKCYEEDQVAFFSACYRRERGVLSILQEADAPVPRIFGGHLGSRLGVIFLEDVGTTDLAGALRVLAADDRAGVIGLVSRGVEALVSLRTHALPVQARLEREIAKIVKEVLTQEYYLNTTIIALNRILALDRRQLSGSERGRLEVALRPLITMLMDEPKTFIHFEFTPGNLQLADGRVIAVDFEQSTLGPAAFDLATLLYSPEADLNDDEVENLLRFYHEMLPESAPSALNIQVQVLEAAAVMKLLFYAGSAANFFRKFEESHRLDALEWYLQTADRLLRRSPELIELADSLRRYWPRTSRLSAV